MIENYPTLSTLVTYAFPCLSLALAPLLLGMTEKVKATVLGDRNVSIFTPYRDLYSMWRRDNANTLYSPIIQKIAPMLLLIPLIPIILMLPAGTSLPAMISFSGDLVLIMILLSLYRFIQISMAMDSALPLPMIGASRWTTLSILTDPILLLSMITASILTRASSLSGVCVPYTQLSEYAVAPLILIFLAMVALILCETGRIPFDFSTPGFETTQVHRLLTVNYSGKELAMITYANALKYWILIQIASTITFVHLQNLFYDILMQFLLPFMIAGIIGVFDAIRPKTRLTHQPRILIGAMVLSLVALAFAIISTLSATVQS